MNKSKIKQNKDFSPLTKVVLISLVFIILGSIYTSFKVFGGTTFGLTLFTNSDLENGLTHHWTFDGEHIDLASTTAEVLDRVGSNNGNMINF